MKTEKRIVFWIAMGSKAHVQVSAADLQFLTVFVAQRISQEHYVVQKVRNSLWQVTPILALHWKTFLMTTILMNPWKAMTSMTLKTIQVCWYRHHRWVKIQPIWNIDRAAISPSVTWGGKLGLATVELISRVEIAKKDVPLDSLKLMPRLRKLF